MPSDSGGAVDELRYLGITELSGGLVSFVFGITVLYFMRLKEATHFCNSSILFAFIITHCLQAITYFLKGATSLSYLSSMA